MHVLKAEAKRLNREEHGDFLHGSRRSTLVNDDVEVAATVGCHVPRGPPGSRDCM